MLSEISQRKTSTVRYYLYVQSEKIKPVENRIKWLLPGDGGTGEGEDKSDGV